MDVDIRAGMLKPGAYIDLNEVHDTTYEKQEMIHHHKTHHRIVFNEVCKSLHGMASLPDVFWALYSFTCSTP